MKRSHGFILTLLFSLALLAALSVTAYADEPVVPGNREVFEQSPAAQLLMKLGTEYFQNTSPGDFMENKEELFKAMISICDKVIAAYPDDPTGYEYKAQVLVESGRGLEALELADKVAALTPGKQDGSELKVIILSRAGRSDEALAIADKVIEADPKAEEMYQFKIGELRRLEKTAEALALVDKLIQNNPDAMTGYYEKFSLLREMKRYPEALAAADMLIEKEPGMAYEKMGLLKEMGKTDEALSVADRMIAAAPDSEEIYMQKAALLEDMKRNDEALAVLDKAIEIIPGSMLLYSRKMNLLQEMKRYEEAVTAADRLIAVAPENPEGYTKKIELLKYSGRFEDVPGVMAAAVKLDPKSAQGFYGKAMMLENLGRYDDAVAAYDKGMALDASTKTDQPGMPGGDYIIGEKVKCLIEGGRYGEALAICEGKAAQKARGLEVYKAAALEKTGRHEEALKAVKSLNSFDGYRLEELDCQTLQLALIESRLTKDAKRQDLESYGDTLVKLDRFDDAVAAYDKALKIKPSKEEVYGDSNPDSSIIGSRAGALLRLGRYDEAVAGYRVYAKDNGDCGCSKMSLAFTLKKRGTEGDDKEAAKLLREVVDKGEKDIRTAMAYALLGERSKMLDLVALLVRLDPKNKKELRKAIEFGEYRNDESFLALVND